MQGKIFKWVVEQFWEKLAMKCILLECRVHSSLLSLLYKTKLQGPFGGRIFVSDEDSKNITPNSVFNVKCESDTEREQIRPCNKTVLVHYCKERSLQPDIMCGELDESPRARISSFFRLKPKRIVSARSRSAPAVRVCTPKLKVCYCVVLIFYTLAISGGEFKV